MKTLPKDYKKADLKKSGLAGCLPPRFRYEGHVSDYMFLYLKFHPLYPL
jgi:hypothetical protein